MHVQSDTVTGCCMKADADDKLLLHAQEASYPQISFNPNLHPAFQRPCAGAIPAVGEKQRLCCYVGGLLCWWPYGRLDNKCGLQCHVTTVIVCTCGGHNPAQRQSHKQLPWALGA